MFLCGNNRLVIFYNVIGGYMLAEHCRGAINKNSSLLYQFISFAPRHAKRQRHKFIEALASIDWVGMIRHLVLLAALLVELA